MRVSCLEDLEAGITKPPGAVDCSEWIYDCSIPNTMLGTSVTIDAFAFLYFLVYIYIMRLAVWDLRRRPYHDNKMVRKPLPPFQGENIVLFRLQPILQQELREAYDLSLSHKIVCLRNGLDNCPW
jgi:hypothetical protein